MRPFASLIGMALASAIAGCASTLEPAPGAHTVPGRGTGAKASSQGITIVASTGAWNGRPRHLRGVAPILVQVSNGSERPLRVRYDAIRLDPARGTDLPALPPYRIEGTQFEPVGMLRYPHDRFWLEPHAPALHRGRTLSSWADPFTYDPWYHGYFPLMEQVELPTSDMLKRALPEGVVEPLGHASGFVFFERPDRDAGAVDFVADLVDANTGQRFGTVRIAFTHG